MMVAVLLFSALAVAAPRKLTPQETAAVRDYESFKCSIEVCEFKWQTRVNPMGHTEIDHESVCADLKGTPRYKACRSQVVGEFRYRCNKGRAIEDREWSRMYCASLEKYWP